jgi:hypothetical protein
VELVVPLRQGTSPRDDVGTLDLLGFADFALACVVRGPQPVYVLRVALLDDAGEPLAGGVLVELTLAPGEMLLDYLCSGFTTAKPNEPTELVVFLVQCLRALPAARYGDSQDDCLRGGQQEQELGVR